MNDNDSAQQQSTNERKIADTDEQEIHLLKVTMTELTLGNVSGRVYESSSGGSVFFLADRSDVRNRVRQQLEMKQAQLLKKT